MRYNSDEIKKRTFQFIQENEKYDQSKPALKYFTKSISTGELEDNIKKTAIASKNLGIKKDEVVYIFGLNTPEIVTTFYALNEMGAVSEWFNPKGMTVQMMRDFINKNNIKHLVITNVMYLIAKEAIKGTQVEKVIVNNITDSFDLIANIGYFYKVVFPNMLNNSKFAKAVLDDNALMGRIFADQNDKNELYYQLEKLRKYSKEELLHAKVAFDNDQNRDSRFITWDDFIKNYYREDKGYSPVKYEDEKTTLIVHTGGTTGPVKRIEMTDSRANASAYQVGQYPINFEHYDSFMQIIPPIVATGLSAMHMARYYNQLTYLVPSYSKDEFWPYMIKNKINHTLAVPAFVKTIIDNPLITGKDLSFLKSLNYGGEAMPAAEDIEVDKILKAHGCQIQNSIGFGQNEEFGAFSINIALNGVPKAPGCCGYPFPGSKAVILDENGNDLGIGYDENGKLKVGMLYVSGPTVMKQYYDNDEANAKTIKYINGEKFIKTGDSFSIDEYGRLWFVTRDERIIRTKSGGKVFAVNLENLAKSINGVADACSVKMVDLNNDSVPTIYIAMKTYEMVNETPVFYTAAEKEVLKNNIVNEMIRLNTERNYDYYDIKQFIFCDEIPLTSAMNKAHYRVLEHENQTHYQETNGNYPLVRTIEKPMNEIKKEYEELHENTNDKSLKRKK